MDPLRASPATLTGTRCFLSATRQPMTPSALLTRKPEYPGRDGRPREIRWGDRTIPVTAVAAVRREKSAYPAATGPRRRRSWSTSWKQRIASV